MGGGPWTLLESSGAGTGPDPSLGTYVARSPWRRLGPPSPAGSRPEFSASVLPAAAVRPTADREPRPFAPPDLAILGPADGREFGSAIRGRPGGGWLTAEPTSRYAKA